MRVCVEPGCPHPAFRRGKCRRHLETSERARQRRRGDRYGGPHRQRKLDLLAEAVPGLTLCAICREPFRAHQLTTTRTHLHHLTNPPRLDQTALTHALCNLRAGQPKDTRPT